LKLPAGRLLTYELGGDPAGAPVFFAHGTGDSRLARHPDDGLTASLGVRLITADRPGVGGSTQQPKRSLLGWVPDLEALLDSLGSGASPWPAGRAAVRMASPRRASWVTG